LSGFADILANSIAQVTPISLRISPKDTAEILESLFVEHAINLTDDMVLAHTIKNISPKGNIKYAPLETLSILRISSSSSSAGNLTHALTQCADIMKRKPLDGKKRSHVLVIWAGGRSEASVDTQDYEVDQTPQSKHRPTKKKPNPKLVLIFRPQKNGDLIFAKMSNTPGGTYHVSTTFTSETSFTFENMEELVKEKQRKDISKTGLPYYDRDSYTLYNADTTAPKYQVLLLSSLLLLMLLCAAMMLLLYWL
jgi:hypothetical protein